MSYFVPSSVPSEGLGVLLLFKLVEKATPDFFSPLRPIVTCRAPGRLDVLSGFGDAGALALHQPISEAACIALQRRDDELVRLWSPGGGERRTDRLSVRLCDLGLPDEPIAGAEARAFLCADPRDAWSAHVLGALLVLARERGLRIDRGFEVLLYSDVPETAGAGSSAAIQVAAVQAFATVLGLELGGRELATLAHGVERDIVGVDRGVAAHVTAACCDGGRLLALRGAAGTLEAEIALPEGLEFVGIDSGAGTALAPASEPGIGRDETRRAERFAELLQQPLTPATREELGELLFASHTARSGAGQRHDAVEILLQKARERQLAGAGLIGASAVGRGTVVLLGEVTRVWHEALRLKKALRDATGHSGHVFRWSSPGAEAFGSVELLPAE